MNADNQRNGIDEYAVKQIKHKARQLVRHSAFTDADLDDLEQELTLDLLNRLRKYNPRRAQRNTFIARVVEHKAATILEAASAARHRERACALSLSDRIETAEGELIELGDTINERDRVRRHGAGFASQTEMSDLRMDLQAAVASLPPQLRRLCNLLETMTVTEVASTLGVSRAAIYRRIKKIRAAFEAAGL